MTRRAARHALPARRRGLPPVKLALQGGGAHGAFTWGVLERLLEEPDFRFTAVSGTSAGAMNAVVLADGWRRGRAQGARDNLARLWQAVADLARIAPVRQGALPQLALDLTAQLLSPYQLNPMGVNPLRKILERLVDFPALDDERSPKVVVAATDVASGQAALFEGPRLGVDAVLASACLPQICQAVEIDGRSYWDGGYTCNPPLRRLALMPGARHLLLVQINPLKNDDSPRTAPEIRNRIGEIVFGQSLQDELDELARCNRRHWLARTLDPDPQRRRLARNALLRIDGSATLAALDPMTKIIADHANLNDLKARGRAGAEAWIDRFRGAGEGSSASKVREVDGEIPDAA